MAAQITIPPNVVQGSITPSQAWGSGVIAGQGLVTPLIPGDTYPDGVTAASVNRIAIVSGTLTNATPGTTDTLDIDLTSLTDLSGKVFTDMVKLCGHATFVETAVAGIVLAIKGTGTNDFLGLFNGVSTGQIAVGPAVLDAQSGLHFGKQLNDNPSLAAYPIDATHKKLRYYSGSAATLTFRALIWGRTA